MGRSHTWTIRVDSTVRSHIVWSGYFVESFLSGIVYIIDVLHRLICPLYLCIILGKKVNS